MNTENNFKTIKGNLESQQKHLYEFLFENHIFINLIYKICALQNRKLI